MKHKIQLSTCKFVVDKTKLLSNNKIFTFKKVTDKGYQFVNDKNERLFKYLMYSAKTTTQQELEFHENEKIVKILLPVKIANLLELQLHDYRQTVNKRQDNID